VLKRIGRFEIQATIDEDASGTLYVATDRETGAAVYLRALSSTKASRGKRAGATLPETGTWGLKHPNVLEVCEIGRGPDPAFIAYEYFEGETLEVLLARSAPMSTEAALELLSPIADALSSYHRLGRVYGHLNPNSVLVSSEGIPKLLPLELVRIYASAPAATLPLRGAAAYMSPEQIRGLPGDARADVYSLGVLALVMLTGATPVADRSIVGLIDAVTSDEEFPADSLRTMAPRVAPTVLRAVSKDREARYGSVREFLDDFRASVSPRGTRA